MNKTIIHKEEYESPLTKVFNVSLNRAVLTGSNEGSDKSTGNAWDA